MPISKAATEEILSHEAGFTLLELLVALVLFSMVGLTFVHFQTYQLGASRQLSSQTAARLAADNLSVDLIVAPAAPRSPLSGDYQQAGYSYHWQATPRPVPASGDSIEERDIPGLVALELQLSNSNGAVLQQRTLVRPVERKMKPQETQQKTGRTS